MQMHVHSEMEQGTALFNYFVKNLINHVLQHCTLYFDKPLYF